MNDPIFQWVAEIDPRWGQITHVVSRQGVIIAATDRNYILQIAEYNGSYRIRAEIFQGAPMPSPI
jgi:hypothetical protein